EKYIKHSISGSDTPNDKKDLKLFLLLTNKNNEITSNILCKELNCTISSLHTLKSRLYQKITEALTSDKHITNTEVFDKRDIISFTLRKKLLFFRISLRSLNQEKTETLFKVLGEIVDTAREYELYDVLTEALTEKKYFKGIRAGIKEFEQINDEIDFFNYNSKAVFFAADSYYRLVLNNHFIKSFSHKELDKYILSSINQMEIDYKRTKSQQVNYYLHILYFALCEREKKYLEAISYCNKLISLLKKSKVIYRKERMGFLLDNISQFKTFIGNYEEAAIDAKKAQGYYIENSLNFIVSKQQELYAYMCDNNEQQALRCLEKLLNHSLIDTGEFRKSKYIYYQSCVLFISKKYKEALSLLKMSMEIEKDKTRWNISLRILNIMLFIELEKIDEAGRSLESLRKHMERQVKEEEVKLRDILIVKLLRELEKDGFEFQGKNTIISKMLNELSEKDTPVSWEHYSAELVPFHKWLERRKK
nr:hypothetical protein [Bacteroidota bacterium]